MVKYNVCFIWLWRCCLTLLSTTFECNVKVSFKGGICTNMYYTKLYQVHLAICITQSCIKCTSIYVLHKVVSSAPRYMFYTKLYQVHLVIWDSEMKWFNIRTRTCLAYLFRKEFSYLMFYKIYLNIISEKSSTQTKWEHWYYWLVSSLVVCHSQTCLFWRGGCLPLVPVKLSRTLLE